MKHPKEKRMYCKHCKSHEIHKTTQYKPGKSEPMAQGRRRYDMKQATLHNAYNKRFQSRPIFRKKAKNTRKIGVRQKCVKCGHINQTSLTRCRAFELIQNQDRTNIARSNRLYGRRR